MEDLKANPQTSWLGHVSSYWFLRLINIKIWGLWKYILFNSNNFQNYSDYIGTLMLQGIPLIKAYWNLVLKFNHDAIRYIFCGYESCPRCRINHSTCWSAVQRTTTVLRTPPMIKVCHISANVHLINLTNPSACTRNFLLPRASSEA